jgi:anti-sigma-K factor RskA
MTEDFRLIAYVDGQLDAAAAREVERLLKVDEHARALVRIYEETAQVLREACADGFYVQTSGSEPGPRRHAPATALSLART